MTSTTICEAAVEDDEEEEVEVEKEEEEKKKQDGMGKAPKARRE